MVPMLDNLNHSYVSRNLELINTDLHLEEDDGGSDYYRQLKFKNNYSNAFEGTEINEDNKLNVEGHFDSSLYQKNFEAYSASSIAR